jgi:alkanesulfonate monooxygenase SsuD/methylene tetrahydromethanopterin reductase-like flavin-dependent oxidoreductase (luciferase family)
MSDGLAARFANFRRICEQSGRDPAEVRLSTTLPVRCGPTRGEAARRAATLGEASARMLTMGVTGHVMFSIGEFARHGRVSVRMLRHYDAIGLIRTACVDPDTGYRSYQASQLDELNRVIALKDLGFTLQQVQAILATPARSP